MRTALLLLLLLPFGASAQLMGIESYNSDAEIYRQNRVRKCVGKHIGYREGKPDLEYLDSIETFDTLGNILSEQEYWDADTTEGWMTTYVYDKNHRIIEETTWWYDSDDWDRSTYKYHKNGRLKGICEYTKKRFGKKYDLDDCFKVHYRNGKLLGMTNGSGDTTASFTYRGELAYRFDKQNVMTTEYLNGIAQKGYYDGQVTVYERDSTGRLMGWQTFNDEWRLISKSSRRFENGLLIEIIDRLADDEIHSRTEYRYEYFD